MDLKDESKFSRAPGAPVAPSSARFQVHTPKRAEVEATAASDARGLFSCAAASAAFSGTAAPSVTKLTGHSLEKAGATFVDGSACGSRLGVPPPAPADYGSAALLNELSRQGRPGGNLPEPANDVKPLPADVADLARRFFAKVDKNGPVSPVLGTRCWVWLGHVTKRGYGQIRFHGRYIFAHQAALIIDGRPLPEGMETRHLCGNKDCPNFDHVVAGTRKQNANDTDPAGRKATDEQADRIRREVAEASYGQKGRVLERWAAALGATRRCVEYIAHGQTYLRSHPLKPPSANSTPAGRAA